MSRYLLQGETELSSYSFGSMLIAGATFVYPNFVIYKAQKTSPLPWRDEESTNSAFLGKTLNLIEMILLKICVIRIKSINWLSGANTSLADMNE